MRLPDSPGKIHLRLTRLRRKHALHRRLLMPLLCVWLFRHGQLARSLARSLRSHSYHPRVTERCKQVFKDRANEYFSFAERRSVRCSSIFCSRSLSRFAVQVVVIVFCADFVKGNKSVRTKGLYFRDFLCLWRYRMARPQAVALRSRATSSFCVYWNEVNKSVD